MASLTPARPSADAQLAAAPDLSTCSLCGVGITGAGEGWMRGWGTDGARYFCKGCYDATEPGAFSTDRPNQLDAIMADLAEAGDSADTIAALQRWVERELARDNTEWRLRGSMPRLWAV